MKREVLMNIDCWQSYCKLLQLIFRLSVDNFGNNGTLIQMPNRSITFWYYFTLYLLLSLRTKKNLEQNLHFFENKCSIICTNAAYLIVTRFWVSIFLQNKITTNNWCTKFWWTAIGDNHSCSWPLNHQLTILVILVH